MKHSIPSKNSQPAFLLLHGFGGDPWEVEPLAAALKERGCLVAVPTIKGLSISSRRDMARYAYEEWIWAAEEAYKALNTQSDRIILAGFSTGGLIAVHLAIRHNPDAIIFMSTPVKHWDLKRIMKNLGEDIKNRTPDHLGYYLKSTIKFPLRALWEFKRIQSETKSKFGQVRCPALILQGLDDDTVHYKSAAFIQKGLQSSNKNQKAVLAYFEPAGHVLLQGPARDQALQRILKFLEDSCIL